MKVAGKTTFQMVSVSTKWQMVLFMKVNSKLESKVEKANSFFRIICSKDHFKTISFMDKVSFYSVIVKLLGVGLMDYLKAQGK